MADTNILSHAEFWLCKLYSILSNFTGQYSFPGISKLNLSGFFSAEVDKANLTSTGKFNFPNIHKTSTKFFIIILRCCFHKKYNAIFTGHSNLRNLINYQKHLQVHVLLLTFSNKILYFCNTNFRDSYWLVIYSAIFQLYHFRAVLRLVWYTQVIG